MFRKSRTLFFEVRAAVKAHLHRRRQRRDFLNRTLHHASCSSCTTSSTLPLTTAMSTVRIGRDDSKHPQPLQHIQADHEPFGHIHFEHEHRRTISVPPIPDLRFEHTYLRNIRQHVRVENSKPPGASNLKEKGETQEASLGTEVVHVRWGMVLWITVKEQIVSPLVQGMLWYVRMPHVFHCRSNCYILSIQGCNSVVPHAMCSATWAEFPGMVEPRRHACLET